jgi:hypothetical protein
VLEAAAQVSVYVYNMPGKLVDNPVKNKTMPAGTNNITYTNSRLPGGIYLIVVEIKWQAVYTEAGKTIAGIKIKGINRKSRLVSRRLLSIDWPDDLLQSKNFIVRCYAQRNVPAILIILLALLLIAMVIWWYDKRIENVEKKTKPVLSIENTGLRHF